MAQIPPKKFYKLSRQEQEEMAVTEMQKCYEMAEVWKKLSQQARVRHIPEPDPRPDEIAMKDL